MPYQVNRTTDVVTGETVETVIPWTVETLIAAIAEKRWEKEVAGFMLDATLITTQRHEAAHWKDRVEHAKRVLENDPEALEEFIAMGGAYPYKPDGNLFGMTLSPHQVIRAYRCMRWYVNTCFGTEIYLQSLIAQGVPLENVAAAALSNDTWPTRQMLWNPE
jgi:hypothetical protein